MTQSELEKMALMFRTTGLNSSWNELMILGEELAGNIGEAYKTLLSLPEDKNQESYGTIYLSQATFDLLQKRLEKALGTLAGQEAVTRINNELIR